MRTLEAHKVNECNMALAIRCVGKVGVGGACTNYKIDGPIQSIGGIESPKFQADLRFQNGPVADGVNGVTHEALLAIVMDRLEGFQAGEFSCVENDMALMYLKQAFNWLVDRTKRRQRAGVEGTHQK